MSTRVQLYVYDLSNGLAGQLSVQLTGRQIDGIWSGFFTFFVIIVLTVDLLEGTHRSSSLGKRFSTVRALASHLLVNLMYVGKHTVSPLQQKY